MKKEYEYRVRPVTRYVVTRYEGYDDGAIHGGGSECLGEFNREDLAIRVMDGLAATEVNAPNEGHRSSDGKSIKWTEE